MTIPIRCSGVRMGGPEHDYRDIPCPEFAVLIHNGKPLCAAHYEHSQAREREAIAETLTDGVPLDRLRAIREAGGLAKLLEAFDEMYAACWHGGFARCNAACKAAEPFRVKEDAT